MKRIHLILAVLFISSTLLTAQDDKSKSLGVYLGAGNLKKQDLIFSPFVASDWSMQNVLLEYEKNAKTNQKIRLRVGQFYDYIGASYTYYDRGREESNWPHSFTNLDLNYSLSKSIVKSENWTVSLGGRVRNRFQIANFNFGNDGQFSYNLASGLDATASVDYAFEKHSLSVEIALPIFSFQARSPYTSQDDHYLERITVHGDLKIFAEHLKTYTFQTWNTSQVADLQLGYKYSLNSHWDLGIDYLFVLNRHTSPVLYTSIENIVYLGTTFKF